MFNSKTFNGPVPTNFTPEQTTAWQTTGEQFQSMINNIEKYIPAGPARDSSLNSLYTAYCVTSYALTHNWKQTY